MTTANQFNRFRRSRIFAIAALSCGLVSTISAGVEPIADSSSTDVSTTESGTGNYTRSPFHITVAVRGGYDDNVNTTHFDTQDSWFSNASIGLAYTAGNARTQLNFNGGAGATYYFDAPSDHDWDYNLYAGVSLTHKATPRLTLSASLYASYLNEPDFSIGNFGLNRRSGNYFYTLDRFSVAYQWAPRFATATSYTLGALRYDSSTIGEFENRVEHTFGQEFKFLVLPTTSLVGEYRFQYVDYQSDFRDSTTHFLLAGVDHSFSPRLSASVRAGVEFREYDNNTLFDGGSRTSPYFEGTLSYAVGRRTSVSWTNRYSLEEPDIPGAPSRTTFRTGLQARYGITDRITASLGVYYQHDDNSGVENLAISSPAFAEDSFDIAVGLRYAITRNLAFDLGYTHTEVVSDILLREYARNRYYTGLSLSF